MRRGAKAEAARLQALATAAVHDEESEVVAATDAEQDQLGAAAGMLQAHLRGHSSRKLTRRQHTVRLSMAALRITATIRRQAVEREKTMRMAEKLDSRITSARSIQRFWCLKQKQRKSQRNVVLVRIQLQKRLVLIL